MIQRWAAGVLLAIVLGVCSYLYGRKSVVRDQTYAARVDTVRQMVEAQAQAAETVTVRLKAKARVDTLVRVLTDTELVIRATPASPPDTVRVPGVVVERLVTDDRAIQSLRALVVADSGVVRSLRALLATPKPVRKWGIGATVGWGCNQTSCGPAVALGLTVKVF